MLADPKPAKRIRDKAAISRFLLANDRCEGCGSPSTVAHHVLFRSHGGDDVPGNLLALCHHHHGRIHQGDVRSTQVPLVVRRRVDVLDYLDAKLGVEAAGAFLDRVYPL